MNIRFEALTEASFHLYKSWFKDPELNKRLGPMDNETWESWQQHHADQENKSDELVAFLHEDPVAVVDVVLPTKEDPVYCIISFATHPEKKRTGIGTAVLKGLMERYTIGQVWRCHIDHQNVPSIRFFEKNGWKQITEVNEHGMISYELVME